MKYIELSNLKAHYRSMDIVEFITPTNEIIKLKLIKEELKNALALNFNFGYYIKHKDEFEFTIIYHITNSGTKVLDSYAIHMNIR